MPLEIIGILHYSNYSEIFPRASSEFDADFVRDCSQAHDAAGFDRVLIANSAQRPDSMPIAAFVAAVTKNLKFMIAHRPGFIVPTMTARMLATIDQLSKGRCGVHIITGGDEPDQRRDGDFLDKEHRYDRSREYVEIMRRMWSSDAPFDHAGDYYRVEGAFEEVKPYGPEGIPIFWGGTSPKAIEHGAAVADIYAMPGFAVDRIRQLIAQVRAEAAKHGRQPEFLISIRVIVEDTEEGAWARADDYLDRFIGHSERQGFVVPKPGQTMAAAVAEAKEKAQEGALIGRVWRGIAQAPSRRPAMPCLVGGRQELLETLLEYFDAGVTRFILSGYEPIPDTQRMGQGLIADFRAAVAGRERGAA